MKISAIAVALGLLSFGGVASAATVDYAGATNTVGNCIPFGCPDSYDPHMGFVYTGIAGFTLNAGDIIAFDTGRRNDTELSFNLSLGATTLDGGATVDANGFTSVATLRPGTFGDDIVGNYDIEFVVNTTFSFVGGGLIVDFENTNGAVDDTSGPGNLVYSLDSPYTVRRYFDGTSVGDMSNANPADGTKVVGNMRIITNDISAVPLPAGLPLLAAGIGALALLRRRKAA